MSDRAARATAAADAPSGRVPALADSLLVQCGPAVEDVLPMLPAGSGLVVSGKKALNGVKSAHAAGHLGPHLVDRRRYAGKARVRASAPITPEWIEGQRTAHVARVLTDSGYLEPGDSRGLANILESAVRLGSDVVAVLPVHTSWLCIGLPELVAQVLAHQASIAMVVEHSADPFAVRRNLRGYVQLLRAVRGVVEVIQLSSDVSALGALAFGATGAAVGVRPSLRHLYPENGGGFSRCMPAVLFDPGLSFVHVDKLARGVSAMPDDPMWLCDCLTCAGRRIDWLLFATETEQQAHTFELLAQRHDHLTSAPPGPIREQVWRAACASAEYQFTSVAVARVGWEVPPALRHWQDV